MKGRSVQTSVPDNRHVKELLVVLLCPQNPIQGTSESPDLGISFEEFRQDSRKAKQLVEQGGNTLAARELLRALSASLAHPDVQGNLFPIVQVVKGEQTLIYGVNVEMPRVPLAECQKSFVDQLNQVVGFDTTQVSHAFLTDFDPSDLTVFARRTNPKSPVEIGVNSTLTVDEFEQVQHEIGATENKDQASLISAAWKCDTKSLLEQNHFENMLSVVREAITKGVQKHFVPSEFTEIKEEIVKEEMKEVDIDSIVMSLANIPYISFSWNQHKVNYVEALNKFAIGISMLSNSPMISKQDHKALECLLAFVKKQLVLVDVESRSDAKLEEWRAKSQDIETQLQQLNRELNKIDISDAVQIVMSLLERIAKHFRTGIDLKVNPRGVTLPPLPPRFRTVLKEMEPVSEDCRPCDDNDISLLLTRPLFWGSKNRRIHSSDPDQMWRFVQSASLTALALNMAFSSP